jgi:hypothetical protein
MKFTKPPWKFLGEENAATMLTEAGSQSVMFVRIISGEDVVFVGTSMPRDPEEVIGNLALITHAGELYGLCKYALKVMHIVRPDHQLVGELEAALDRIKKKGTLP